MQAIINKLKLIRHEFEWFVVRRGIFNSQPKQHLIVVIASAHKVGSTWIYGLVKDAFDFDIGFIPKEFEEGDNGTIMLDKPLIERYFMSLNGNYIFKSHSYPTTQTCNSEAKIITILRDPRDVIVSCAFYLSNLSQDNGGWGEDFQRLSDTDKICAVINKGDFIIDRLQAWQSAENVLKIKFEDLIESPQQQLDMIKSFLHLDTNFESSLNVAIQKNSFEIKSKGRQQGKEEKNEFYRKGIVGDWRNYFNEEIVTLFKNSLNSRWNQFLLEMEYENSKDWSL